MARRIVAGAVAILGLVMTMSALAPAAGAATTYSLAVSQGDAFSVLGRSCGGIQEQSFATKFKHTNGLPTGYVYVQTRCGGSGRGGGYHVTTYSAWLKVTWDLTGLVHSFVTTSAPTDVSATFTATDASGDQIYNVLHSVNVLPENCSVGNITYCYYRAYLTVP
jgi:hypothetical protein